MRIVLLTPSGSVADGVRSLELSPDELLHTTIIAVSTVDHVPVPATIVSLGPTSASADARIARYLERSVIGRNLKRLSPMDNGRRFARAARKDKRFRDAVASADLIIALERDAILAAWTGLRRWSSDRSRGVYGLAPRRAVLTELRRPGASHP